MDHIHFPAINKLKHQDYSYDYASTLVKRRNTERVYSLSEERIVHLQKKEKKKMNLLYPTMLCAKSG